MNEEKLKSIANHYRLFFIICCLLLCFVGLILIFIPVEQEKIIYNVIEVENCELVYGDKVLERFIYVEKAYKIAGAALTITTAIITLCFICYDYGAYVYHRNN